MLICFEKGTILIGHWILADVRYRDTFKHDPLTLYCDLSNKALTQALLV